VGKPRRPSLAGYADPRSLQCSAEATRQGALPGQYNAAQMLDTAPEAARVRLTVYRRMGAARRAAVAMQMCDDSRGNAAAGIRARHPEYSDEQVQYALNRLVLGDELFRAAWPSAPALDP